MKKRLLKKYRYRPSGNGTVSIIQGCPVTGRFAGLYKVRTIRWMASGRKKQIRVTYQRDHICRHPGTKAPRGIEET